MMAHHFMPKPMPRMAPSQQAKRSSWSPSVSNDTKENQAGVGILFVEEEDPSGFVRVTVKALIEGGSAERTGMVRSGDMVVRVGNQDVIGKPLSVLRTMIPGPIGSYCRLGFLRGGVALNSNAVQEKSTYYDVQLLRQPTKNEKRKLVPGTTGADAASPAPSNDSSTQASQASTDRASLSQSMDRSGPQSAAGMRDSTGRQPSAEPVPFSSPAVDKRQNNLGQPQQPAAPQRASPPSAQSNPGLSQSFDQRTMKPAPTNQQKSLQAPQETNTSPNAHLRTSVDAAINNVDRALSEMHRQEVDRLKARIDAMDRERAGVDEELLRERAARKQQDEKIRDLDSQVRGASSFQQQSYNAGPGSPEKRKVEALEKQVAQLKQDKQREEMQRLEAESTLKTVERRANELQHQLEQMQRQGRGGGADPNKILFLEQQLHQSEERRKEEEKKRAIAEGKSRHLENQLKQQSPFKYANIKGKKGPPAHMPDISEGREMQQGIGPGPGVMMDGVGARSPSLGAIDGPLPDALAGQYMAMPNGMMMAPMPGAQGMQQPAPQQQQHMGQGIPGVDIYSSQGSSAAASQSLYGSQQQAANYGEMQQQRMQMQMQPMMPGGGGVQGQQAVPQQPRSAPQLKNQSPQQLTAPGSLPQTANAQAQQQLYAPQQGPAPQAGQQPQQPQAGQLMSPPNQAQAQRLQQRPPQPSSSSSQQQQQQQQMMMQQQMAGMQQQAYGVQQRAQGSPGSYYGGGVQQGYAPRTR